MKRCIATLLTLGMVLSLVGCSKETEETKKKKKKKSTTTTESVETEVPDTSDTVDPSDTSETSEESTAATSQSTADPISADPVSVNLSHDLQMLEFTNEPINVAYGAPASVGGDTIFYSLEEHCDYYTLNTPGYDSLGHSITLLFESEKYYCFNLYNESMYGFADIISNVSEEDKPYNAMSVQSSASFTRADERVCSILINHTYWSFYMDYEYSYQYYNYDSKTGQPILFDNIVTDRELFAEAILAYQEEPDQHADSKLYNSALEKGANAVRYGEELSFLLYQNCIVLSLPQVGDSDEIFTTTLSALELGSCVDQSYFTESTPYYSLSCDAPCRIRWDFDEDGILDTIDIANTADDYTVSLSVLYNGTQVIDGSFTTDEMEWAYAISWANMCYTDTGYYLYIELAEEDPVYSTLVFHLENEQFVYVGTMGEFDKYPFNPECCQVNTRSDLLGTGHKTATCSLMENGMPVNVSPILVKTATALTTKDMTLETLDEQGNPSGEVLKVPANSPVMLLGINTEKDFAIFTTLTGDETTDTIFKMLVYEDEYGDFDVAFDLQGQHDLFTGMNFYD